MYRLHVCLVILLSTTSAWAQELYDDTVVRELRIEFAQANWQQLLKDNVATESDIPARLTVDGIVYDSIGIRFKGNSSYNIPGDKKPFNISMDSYKPDQLLYGYSTLNLNNCFKDPTFCREKITYELAARYLPAAKSAYVKVYINNVYWGVYLNVQQLNKTFLREWFGNNDGNNYKCDPHGSLQWNGKDTARYKADYEKKTNEDVADWSDLVRCIEVLNTIPAASFPAEIEKVLNVDRALWYIAFSNTLVNLDSYIGSAHNYYFYHNPTDNRFSMIPWDMNEVLGVFQMGLNVQQLEQLPIDYGKQGPLVSKLLAVPTYRARYIAHMRTLLAEALDDQFWSHRISTHQNLIRTSVENDTKKLYTLAWFSQNVNENVTLNGPGGLTIPGILSFVRNRTSYLRSLPDFQAPTPNISSLLREPLQPGARDSVHIRAMLDKPANTRLWYSIQGKPFQSVPMTELLMNAIWFGATLPPMPAGTNVNYYVSVIDSVGTEVFSPEYAEHSTPMYTVSSETRRSAIVINELLASNKNDIKDPQDQNEDWFELYNTADSTVDVSALYLTDDNNTRRWKIPSGTLMQPHSYLLVWADEDTTDMPGLHANFKLSKSGEGLYLYDSDANGNALLDSISFGTQVDDVSLARFPNGSGPFVAATHTTPGQENTLTSEVSQSELNTPLQLSPQPAHEYLVVRSRNNFETICDQTLVIHDVLGRTCLSTTIHSPNIVIDIRTLPSGYYMLSTSDTVLSFVKFREP